MPSSCAVLNCKDKYGHKENISFHKFPIKRQNLLEKWLEFAERGATWQPSKWSAICSRHFRDEDFNCANERKTLKKTAVPSIQVFQQLCEHRLNVGFAVQKDTVQKATATTTTGAEKGVEETELEQEEAQMAVLDHIAPGNSLPKVNCRFCGIASITTAVVTFATNFEIYGMIQKCFPTLNIQQDDNFPKDICRLCLKRLENFSRFIDKVCETQSELQRKFRIEKSNCKTAERQQLKIKQEPVVRVKQEVAEGFESFLSDDMDMGVDDSCEQGDGGGSVESASAVEQKFDFCDFPILNAQDIINNCDIMEIINLDDPFINIPDDDANTNCDSSATAQLPTPTPTPASAATTAMNANSLAKRPFPSAHELLQSHLLIEEHNYANAAEDFKEEWQIKNYYKTEKDDDYEQEEAEDVGNAEHEEDYQNYGLEDNGAVNASVNMISASCENRSLKPIVTSVSAIAERRLQFPPLDNAATPTDTGKPVVTAVNDLRTMKQHEPQTYVKSHNKPNIVVLNESIVKSAPAFQLHACNCCQLTFFSTESLNQHYNAVHAQMPMVSVPSINIWENGHSERAGGTGAAYVENCKIEEGYNSKEATLIAGRSVANTGNNSSQNTSNANDTQQIYKGFHCGKYTSGINVNAKNQIKILEMQQTFLRHQQSENSNGNSYFASNNYNERHQQQQISFEANKSVLQNVPKERLQQQQLPYDASKSVQQNIAKEHHPQHYYQQLQHHVSEMPHSTNEGSASRAVNSGNGNAALAANDDGNFKIPYPHSSTSPQKNLYCKSNPMKTNSKLPIKDMNPRQQLHVDLDSYMKLRKRYVILQRKCKSLLKSHQSQSPGAKRQRNCKTNSKRPKCICRICKKSCPTIYHLLRHKQTSHRILPPPTHFSASCGGCEKFFRSKIALKNHTRYICQTLSLRWFKTFKCRYCRSITFTHWRLYRKHELKCKQKMKCATLQHYKRKQQTNSAKRKRKSSKQQHHSLAPPSASQQYACAICCKVFAKEHNLKQHSITHVPQPRDHKCDLCQRMFQRRNALTQHMKCVHFQLKSFACTICSKIFANSNSLNQHSITHTQQRTHKCGLCGRVFKRRNGLTQHMKGYHLQLKPFECPECHHSYALKCDMLRCRHSVLLRAAAEALASGASKR